MTNEQKAKLKAFFASQFFKYADTYGPDWSTLTSGDLEAFSLEAVGKVIDEFDEDKIS
jgi:hypothetical protein